MVYTKYCIVPECKTTDSNSPDKLFISVPTEVKRRKLWMAAAGRNINDYSLKSKFHCCEDHFDLEEDMANFMEYKIMGVKVRMKKESVPHKFSCRSATKIVSDRQHREHVQDFHKNNKNNWTSPVITKGQIHKQDYSDLAPTVVNITGEEGEQETLLADVLHTEIDIKSDEDQITRINIMSEEQSEILNTTMDIKSDTPNTELDVRADTEIDNQTNILDDLGNNDYIEDYPRNDESTQTPTACLSNTGFLEGSANHLQDGSEVDDLLMSACRVCLEYGKMKNETKMIPLCSIVTFEDVGSITIIDMVNDIASIQASNDDGLPAEVCFQCMQQICNAYLLIKQCKLSNIKLQNVWLAKQTRDQLAEEGFINTQDVIFQSETDHSTSETSADVILPPNGRIDIDRPRARAFDKLLPRSTLQVLKPNGGGKGLNITMPKIALPTRKRHCYSTSDGRKFMLMPKTTYEVCKRKCNAMHTGKAIKHTPRSTLQPHKTDYKQLTSAIGKELIEPIPRSTLQAHKTDYKQLTIAIGKELIESITRSTLQPHKTDYKQLTSDIGKELIEPIPRSTLQAQKTDHKQLTSDIGKELIEPIPKSTLQAQKTDYKQLTIDIGKELIESIPRSTLQAQKTDFYIQLTSDIGKELIEPIPRSTLQAHKTDYKQLNSDKMGIGKELNEPIPRSILQAHKTDYKQLNSDKLGIGVEFIEPIPRSTVQACKTECKQLNRDKIGIGKELIEPIPKTILQALKTYYKKLNRHKLGIRKELIEPIPRNTLQAHKTECKQLNNDKMDIGKELIEPIPRSSLQAHTTDYKQLNSDKLGIGKELIEPIPRSSLQAHKTDYKQLNSDKLGIGKELIEPTLRSSLQAHISKCKLSSSDSNKLICRQSINSDEMDIDNQEPFKSNKIGIDKNKLTGIPFNSDEMSIGKHKLACTPSNSEEMDIDVKFDELVPLIQLQAHALPYGSSNTDGIMDIAKNESTCKHSNSDEFGIGAGLDDTVSLDQLQASTSTSDHSYSKKMAISEECEEPTTLNQLQELTTTCEPFNSDKIHITEEFNELVPLNNLQALMPSSEPSNESIGYDFEDLIPLSQLQVLNRSNSVFNKSKTIKNKRTFKSKLVGKKMNKIDLSIHNDSCTTNIDDLRKKFMKSKTFRDIKDEATKNFEQWKKNIDTTIVSCKVCNRLVYQYELNKHLQRCDGTATEFTTEFIVQCTFCDKQLLSSKIDLHKQRCKLPPPEQLLTNQEISYSCLLCDISFNNPVLFRTHYDLFHCTTTVRMERNIHLLETKRQSPQNRNKHDEETDENVLQTVENELNFGKTEGKAYDCNVCGINFCTWAGLKNHILIHTKNKLKCPHCAERFIQTGSLLVHLQTHSEEKRLQCEECGIKFTTRTNLQFHLRKHELTDGNRSTSSHLEFEMVKIEKRVDESDASDHVIKVENDNTDTMETEEEVVLFDLQEYFESQEQLKLEL